MFMTTLSATTWYADVALIAILVKIVLSSFQYYYFNSGVISITAESIMILVLQISLRLGRHKMFHQ